MEVDKLQTTEPTVSTGEANMSSNQQKVSNTQIRINHAADICLGQIQTTQGLTMFVHVCAPLVFPLL